MIYEGVEVKWLGHASFIIKSGDLTIATDPYNISDHNDRADLILITHSHYDHCDPESVKKLKKDNTVIVTTKDCADKLTELGGDIRFMAPGDTLNIMGVSITALPAYNIDKNFHPKENGWLGFVININGVNIYQAGDTDKIPEMSKLQNIDIALLPVGGTYTMNETEAAEAAVEIKPKIVIPMHYGSIGLTANLTLFKQRVAAGDPNIKVEILEPSA
ncbi:MBL fold metallo-hydrolase [Candidatus Micrarchaeota archaeon]|nr:MAG: MBL fold metallo-hydrolase [Candidatus Micrarchaeota archaeon]